MTTLLVECVCVAGGGGVGVLSSKKQKPIVAQPLRWQWKFGVFSSRWTRPVVTSVFSVGKPGWCFSIRYVWRCAVASWELGKVPQTAR